MPTDLSPKIAAYRSWVVAVRDEAGDRVILQPFKVDTNREHFQGCVVDLENGILHAPQDVRSLVSKGVWTDEGLPSTESVLGKVTTIL